jgi:hypothetical protein
MSLAYAGGVGHALHLGDVQLGGNGQIAPVGDF